MNISRLSQITFQKAPIIKHSRYAVPTNLTYKNNNGESNELIIENIYNDFRSYPKETSSLYDNTHNSYYINNNKIYGEYMIVKDKNKGTGTVLHLAKIITMLENNCTEIQIKSINTAVIFHAKNGFRSNLQNKKECHYALITMINAIFKSEELAVPASKASDILTKLNWSTDEVNEVFNEFLDIICKLPKEISNSIHFKTSGMQDVLYGMKLTKEDVLKNKDFYNNLFKKYCIDYQID